MADISVHFTAADSVDITLANGDQLKGYRTNLDGRWHFVWTQRTLFDAELLADLLSAIRAEEGMESVFADVEVTAFSLEDFEQLTQEERELLASDEYALGKLRDRFLEATGWSEAAEVAVDAWRAGRET